MSIFKFVVSAYSYHGRSQDKSACIMLKSSYQSKILTTLSTTLPDDRPITSIQIVEYVDKCPKGFVPISKTYDQDQDADLWRESSFLKRKSCRYLCISKSECIPFFVVQDIAILNEKDLPPHGYSLLNRTVDTDQKAWRKKHLCYRIGRIRGNTQAITDIIVCSRLKEAPEGFTLAGEINGVIVCYKMGNVQDAHAENGKTADNSFPYARPPPERPPRPAPAPPMPGAYPSLSDAANGDYEILLPNYTPRRPAPVPPVPANKTYSTLALFHGLEGVPFVLNSKFSSGARDTMQLPVIKARTMQQLKKDYNYDFSVERQN